MSAETLRRAASLMRQRAEAATEGPWRSQRGPGESVVAATEGIAQMTSLRPREDRRHIASWHPAVALAVADWLDVQAERVEVGFCGKVGEQALTVARAYLGESA